jgi:hypothetical protein
MSTVKIYPAYEDVWIGNEAAARALATGSALSPAFGAAFNASGVECLGDLFRKRGIAYDTLMDHDTEMTLGDCAVAVTLRTVADEIVAHGSGEMCTDAAFLHFMYEADRKISRLPRGGKAVLVYCAQGHNRSVSSAMAHAMLSRGYRFDDLSKKIRESAMLFTGMKVLTNQRFASMLETRVKPGGAAEARAAYLRECEDISDLAKKTVL